MKICDWCARQIPWWRIRYCKICGPKFSDPLPSSAPYRPPGTGQFLNEARRRGKERGLPQ